MTIELSDFLTATVTHSSTHFVTHPHNSNALYTQFLSHSIVALLLEHVKEILTWDEISTFDTRILNGARSNLYFWVWFVTCSFESTGKPRRNENETNSFWVTLMLFSLVLLCSVDLASRHNPSKLPTRRTILFHVCLFLFSTCFGQPCAHHQENYLYQYDIWCMALFIEDCLVCTPNGHLYRMTYTRCRIDTINSPDDGHMAARNM
jgi:hypothetical protein